jgi:hypothetical protein
VTDLETQWAWSRVEAMADRSLRGAERRRMRDAMAADPKLERAVVSATALRRELERLAHIPTPTTLRRRLLGIAGDRQHTAPWIRLTATWAVAFAGAAAVAAFVLLRAAPEQTPSPEVARAKTQAEAVEDFAIAMSYLQKSATIANAEVTTAVGGSLHDALSREADHEQKRARRKNGG